MHPPTPTSTKCMDQKVVDGGPVGRRRHAHRPRKTTTHKRSRAKRRIKLSYFIPMEFVGRIEDEARPCRDKVIRPPSSLTSSENEEDLRRPTLDNTSRPESGAAEDILPVLDVGFGINLIQPPPGFADEDNPSKVSEGSMECIKALNQTIEILRNQGYRLKTYKVPEEAFMFWTEYDFGVVQECARLLPTLFPAITKLFLAECKDSADSEAKLKELEEEFNATLFAIQEEVWNEQFHQDSDEEKKLPANNDSYRSENTTPESESPSKITSPPSAVTPAVSEPEPTRISTPPNNTQMVETYLYSFPYPFLENPNQQKDSLEKHKSKHPKQTKSQDRSRQSKKTTSVWPPPPLTMPPPLPPQAWQHFYETKRPPSSVWHGWQGPDYRHQYQPWSTGFYGCPVPPPPPPPSVHEATIINNYFYPPSFCERPLPYPYPYPYTTQAGFPGPPPLPPHTQMSHRISGSRILKSEKSAKTPKPIGSSLKDSSGGPGSTKGSGKDRKKK